MLVTSESNDLYSFMCVLLTTYDMMMLRCRREI
jgi:hypothetical protein